MIKNRNVALYIVLSIVTCGIFALYWFVCIADDANTLSNNKGTSGGVALLLTLVTCGIYGIYWAYKLGESLDAIDVANRVSVAEYIWAGHHYFCSCSEFHQRICFQ